MARSAAARHTDQTVPYALDRLGWLQFQQLCARVLALDAGVAQADWVGAADRCRFVRSEGSLGAPLLDYALPGPVLVHCAWLRQGVPEPATAALTRLLMEHPEELHEIRSYLLMADGELEAPLAAPAGAGALTVAILGTRELGARIDGLAQLRLAMPSLLGLGDVDWATAPEVASRSSLDREAAAELARVFVPTRAHARALDVLAEHRFAVLTGPPEMGKTAVARMVALAKLTAGWEAHECTTPEDVWTAFDATRSQVFIADDAFGSTEYRADAAERWARAMERLLRSLDDRHWLIWTSRPAPLHAALRRLHRERGAERFPSPARVLIDAGDLDPADKTLILFRHAKAAQLPSSSRQRLQRHGRAIVENSHFTPERIRRLVAALAAGEKSVGRAIDAQLTTATEAMATSLATLGDEHRDLLVALLDTAPGPVAERDLVATLRRHHDGSLSHPPAELVDRLADHFLRVLA